MRKKKDTYGFPSYSKKNSQNQKSKSQHSIVHKHQQRLDEFNNKSDKLKIIKDKMISVNKEILKLSNDNSVKTPKILESIRLNKCKFEELENEHKTLNYDNDEIDYLLESTNIINEYMILEQRESELLNVNDLSDSNSSELNELNVKKNYLRDAYLTKFEPGYFNQRNNCIQDLSCKNCRIPYNVENSFLVCYQCGICLPTVEQATELSYKEQQEFDYRPQFTYDKRTHLEDWLRRFQSKENRGIPQEILDKVMLEAKKERVHDLHTLTEDKIKKYLKKLDLNDYYDKV